MKPKLPIVQATLRPPPATSTSSVAAGRAFGIVSTGFNLSGVFAPLLFRGETGRNKGDDLPHDADVRRYLCDDTILPRATAAGMFTRSDRLERRPKAIESEQKELFVSPNCSW